MLKALDITTGNPVTRKWIYTAYWILVTIIFLYDRKYLIAKAGLPSFFSCSFVRIALLIGLAWVNIHILIPRYLFKRRYGEYFSLALLCIIVYLVAQSFYDYFLFGFVLGPYRTGMLSSALIYNFTHTSLYLLLTVALKFSIDWYEQRKVLQDIRAEKLQAEVNFLRAQVNPHFLFNALNNLYALTIKKSELAPEVVLKLSEMMEYMLYESNETTVSMAKEIRYLNNFIELEKLRQGNHADITLTVTGNTDKCSIHPFLLLPLVENAFKHGISQAIHNAYLHITIHADEGIEITVVNNKRANNRREQAGGIGLTNLRMRLELLYPDRYSLNIDDKTDEYRASLKINQLC